MYIQNNNHLSLILNHLYGLLLLSYLPAYKVFPEPVRRSYLCAYKAPFYVSFCTFYASLRLTRTVFTRPKTSIISVNPVILSDIFRVGACPERSRMDLWLKNPCNPCNPWLINDLRAYKALYICRETFTNVMSPLQIRLFMQNKANFKKVKFNVNKVLTRNYDQLDTWSIRKTKPIQSQSKPIQSQLKPIKANQSQSKPIQSQFKAN